MYETRDYSLLHPFDLEKAKLGEAICTTDGELRDFIAEREKKLVTYNPKIGQFSVSHTAENLYYMMPLAWVEGKPVYKGDVLYRKEDNSKTTILNYTSHEISCLDDVFMWQKPKTRRVGWINIYAQKGNVNIHHSKERADTCAGDTRLACIKIEWEE